jgi:hypothetical protein
VTNALVLHNQKAAPLKRVPPPVLQTRVVRRSGARVDPVGKVWSQLNTTQKVMLAVHGAILVAVSYHGYKRNRNSVPWGLAWSLGGLVCPTVTMGFALTQGYATKAS